MTQNILVQAIKSIFLDFIWEILYFPLWWYGPGLKRVALYTVNSIKNTEASLGVSIMFKNIFKPMFGQYDSQGRIISFLMRLLLTIVRTVMFAVLIVFNLVAIVFWVALPGFVLWGILFNFTSIWK
ncbi:hypothetical protein C4566_03025 [Candidatus Parcubacteria bacterium]|nr:MAG: hypothetical protein C4566_03025 [Candidatus Parcubacteria bacterium]